MTVIDSTADTYYGDQTGLPPISATRSTPRSERWREAGCRWVQIDEPVCAREPQRALDFGVEMLDRCFHNAPATTKRAVHICCGYPSSLDIVDYPKAEPGTYFRLAPALEAAAIDAVSIEDAHRHNDLALLEHFPTKTVMLGVVGIARTRIETVEEISTRLRAALEHIDAHRLMAAPDCGLIMLDRPRVIAKLGNLSKRRKRSNSSSRMPSIHNHRPTARSAAGRNSSFDARVIPSVA